MNRLTYKAGFGSFSNETIVLGRVGEHLAQEIVFDCSAFAQLYGMGTAVLCARLPSGEKYPVPWPMSYWNNRRICSANGGLPPMVKRQRYFDALDQAA